MTGARMSSELKKVDLPDVMGYDLKTLNNSEYEPTVDLQSNDFGMTVTMNQVKAKPPKDDGLW